MDLQPGVYEYTASVGAEVVEAVVEATALRGGTTVEIFDRAGSDSSRAAGGSEAVPLSRTVSLVPGTNRIEVEVVAEDDQISRVYGVTVTRGQGVLAGPKLSALTLSGIDIAFDPNTTTYTAGTSLSSTTVTATAADEGASVTIADGDGSSDGATRTASLAPGANTITVTVTLTSGGLTTANTYRLAIHRGNPLTAALENVPASHDGAAAFGVQLRFSEEVVVSDQSLSTGLLTVTGGSVESARRLTSGSNVGWEITVQPGGAADVVITLPAASSCSAAGAVCTSDGRQLASAAIATVAGPGPTQDHGIGLVRGT